MVYNTALGFILFGIGLLCLLSSYRRMGFFFGAYIAGMGVITLIEYIFHIQLGLDELFFKSYLPMNLGFPGRMSPITALSFFASGLSLALLSLKKITPVNYYIILFLGTILFCLSSVAILGYTANLPTTYQWYKLMPMALHTAIGFLVACIGLASFVYNKQVSGRIDLSKAMPIFGFVCVMIFTFLLWRAQYQEELASVQHLTVLESEKIQTAIQKRIEESILDLIGLKPHGNSGVPLSEKQWMSSAEFYKKNHPWYDAILWIDPQYKVMFAASFNNELTSFSKKNAQIKQDLFEKAIINKGVSISPIHNYTPESRGILICIPQYDENKLEGFIIGFINTDFLFKNILKESAESGFNFIFYEGNDQKYSHPNTNKSLSQSINTRADITIYDLNWRFEIQPSAVFLSKKTHTLLSYLILVIGLFVAALLAFVTHSRLASKRLSKELIIMKEMTDAFQACSSLAQAAEIVSKYYTRLLPSTSGSLYLVDDTLKKMDFFAKWGDITLPETAFSIKKCNALKSGISLYRSGDAYEKLCEHTKQNKFILEKENYLCIPLFNHDMILGLLQIQYPHETLGSSLEETLSKQLILTLANLKLRDLLKNQATRDPLTNLFNRRYLDESLPRELYQAKRYSRSLSIIMLDVDHFKTVNDTYGHKAGDMVLKEIGSLLQEKSRKGDIVCRFGGEEFLLVLQEASLEDATTRANQLREEISKLKFTWKESALKHITISLGVSSFPEHGEAAEELISIADEALYLAKEAGRNRVEVGEVIEMNGKIKRLNLKSMF
jgi:diguanylate cyclase (GGDEF)-like protein